MKLKIPIVMIFINTNTFYSEIYLILRYFLIFDNQFIKDKSDILIIKFFKRHMQKENIEAVLPKTASQFIDSDSQGFKQISIKDDIVTADGFNVYLFGTVPISRCSSFTVEFLKMQHGGGLGFVDSQLKHSSYIANEPNVVTYRNDGTCRTGTITKEKVGRGYSSYDKITVSVDQASGKIAWSKDNQLLHVSQFDHLKNTNIEWVPYIRLCDKGDKMRLHFDHEKNEIIAKEMLSHQCKVNWEKEKTELISEAKPIILDSIDFGDEIVSEEEFYMLMTKKF